MGILTKNFNIYNKLLITILLLFLAALLALKTNAAEDNHTTVLIYRKGKPSVEGIIKHIDNNDQLTVESSATYIIPLSKVMAIVRSEEREETEKILHQSNYKTLINQGVKQDEKVPYNVLKHNAMAKFWIELKTIVTEKQIDLKPDENLLISFRILKSGNIHHINVINAVNNLGLKDNAIALLQNTKLPKLPENYTGDWLPEILLVNERLLKENTLHSNILNELNQAEHLDTVARKSNNTCIYRLRSVVNPENGDIIHSKTYSHREVTKQSTKKHHKCNRQFNSEHLLVDLKDIIKASDLKHLTGLSLWFFTTPESVIPSVTEDGTFLQESIKSITHEYVINKMEPVLEKNMYKILKKEKIKLNWDHYRHGRYLITFSQETWPQLKSVKLTTPSGDSRFDNLCKKTLESFNLPELPKLLTFQDYETDYVCAIWR